tara:strand:- start:239 stop:904 length:666 start_codon:yes stop_codon:yes gene_type:complete
MSQTEVQLIKSSSVEDGDIVGMSSSKLSGTLPAVSAANLTNIPAANLTGTLPAINGANLTGISAGITMADQWRLNTGGTLTTDGNTDFNANWERGDTNSQGYIGSAMTESSGVFTFPSTGMYWIMSQMSFKRNSGDNRYAQLQLRVTTDDSNYTTASSGFAIFPDAYNTTNAIANFIFDVTNVSTHKVSFRAYTNRSSVLFLANSTAYEGNSFIFLKLGDT